MYRRLAMLLALVALLLQSATVSAHGLMPVPGGDGETVVLCTPYGVKIVHVGEDGAPAAPRPHGGDDCTLCLHAGGAAAVVPPPAMLPTVVALVAVEAARVALPEAAAIYRAQNPRGPPGRK